MSDRSLRFSVVLVVALLALAACQSAVPATPTTAPASPIASVATAAPPAPTALPSPTVITPTAAPSPALASPTPLPSPSSMPSPTVAQATPTITVRATATSTPRPTATSTRAATPTRASGTSIGGSPAYLDDRSDPGAVVLSYYNSISRKEYDRAYSYWEIGAAGLQSYASFKQGFADTQSVHVTLGQILGDRGAGQIYGFVPSMLTATKVDNSIQVYVGCFSLHLASPQIQDQPPFDPWSISSANVEQPPAGANLADRLANACANQGQAEPTPAATPRPDDISASRYLDDRSTPEQVLRSLFNAVNRKEYDRAYSYWTPGTPSSILPPYTQFKAGYATTASVTLKLGKTTTGAAAGSMYFSVPATLVSKSTSGQTKTYVGCYVLHLSQPAVQDLPPFDPMSIQSATVRQVANNANTASLMATVCPATG